MIKQLIGSLVALAVVAVLVMTLLHRDRYTSMLRFDTPSVQTLQPGENPATREATADPETDRSADMTPAETALPAENAAEPAIAGSQEDSVSFSAGRPVENVDIQ